MLHQQSNISLSVSISDGSVPIYSALAGLDVIGMVYINISLQNGEELSFEGNESPTIEIPVAENAKTKPGMTMPAWYLHRWNGMHKLILWMVELGTVNVFHV